jgi:hypothetical protein
MPTKKNCRNGKEKQMSDIEFEVVREPSPGKPGLLRIKQKVALKSRYEQLAEAAHEMVLEYAPPATWKEGAEYLINQRSIMGKFCKVLLDLDALSKKERDPNNIYKSQVYQAPAHTTFNDAMQAAQNCGYQYYRGLEYTRIYDLRGLLVCKTKDVIDDTEGY